MSTLISADNSWMLFAILVVIAAGSIWLEQRFTWAAKVSACMLCLLFAMALANLRVIPTDAAAYDFVWGYIVPLAIPFLLLQADLRRIWKESGRMLGIFLLGSAGTVFGGILAFFLLRGPLGYGTAKCAAPMFVGTYVGGSVNLVAMADATSASGELVSAAIVADNFLMVLYFFVLVALPGMRFILRHYRHPLIRKQNQKAAGRNNTAEKQNKKAAGRNNAAEKQNQKEAGRINPAENQNKKAVFRNQKAAGRSREAAGPNRAASYWRAKPVSLMDISKGFAASCMIVAVSKTLSGFFEGVIPAHGFFLSLLNGLLGNQYLLITVAATGLATAFPHFFGNIAGAQEIGTFLIHIFFAVIGAPASIVMILRHAPLLLLFAAIIVFMNMVFSLGFGKLFGYTIEEITVASNANIGGPTTSAAFAIAKGWHALVVPALLVGTLGYVIGNYYGVFLYTLF